MRKCLIFMLASLWLSSYSYATTQPISEQGTSAAIITQPTQQGELININQASAQELAAGLNGIGLKKAQKIVEYREQQGLFTQIEQLQEVPGIGSALYERNINRLTL